MRVTRKKCNIKKVKYAKRYNMKKVQDENSAAPKKCNPKKVHLEKNATKKYVT